MGLSAAGRLVALWATGVLVIWALAFYVGRHVKPVRDEVGFPRTPVEALATFDGEHYDSLAIHGYSKESTERRRRFAFFPLLPALAQLLGGHKHTTIAGIAIAQLCLLGSLILLTRLTGVENLPLRQQPGFWLLVSPVAFFLWVFYAESLFLFLTLLMVFLYRRERFGWAALFGLLAGLTRPTVIPLPAVFAWDLISRFRRGEDWTRALFCAISPWIGMSVYQGAVAYITGDPLGYSHLQHFYWGQYWTVPFLPLLREAHGFVHDLAGGHLRAQEYLVRLFSSIGILSLMIWGRRRLDPGFFLYLVAGMLFIHAQEPHSRTARYELTLFPVFVLLSQSVLARPRLAPVAAGLMLAAQVALFIDHARWVWVS